MNSSQFYNRISPIYPWIDLFLKSHKKRLVQEVNNFPKAAILEIGVGQSSHLSQYHSKNITAIDSSHKMLNKAIELNRNDTTFIEMDATNLRFESASFDLVVCSHILSITNDTFKIFEEINRVLKPNASLIILNHITPKNKTAYFYRAFNPIAKIFHFQSYFSLEKYSILNQLSLEKQITFGWNKNYQLLIYQKN